MKNKILTTIIALIITISANGQKPTLFIGATAHLGNGEKISLEERIQLKKYATHIPFIAGKLTQALRKRESLEKDGII